MATDPPSPSRLVNNTETTSPGAYVNSFTTATNNNTPRLSESSQYNRRNSVGSTSQNITSSTPLTPPPPPPPPLTPPPPAPPASSTPTYNRPKTPIIESRDHVSIPPPPPPPPTTTTSSQPSSTITASVAANGYRPLNVKDALTYLDQVKVKFADQPEVYNRFLDIMKEFKSQAIDTPGVIERVSTLFRGHPLLISGFNTFLPPGYRIECSTDDHARDIIRVTTPSGTTSTTNGEPFNLQSESNNHMMDSSRYYNSQNSNYNKFRSNGPLPPISSYHPPPPPPPPPSSAPPSSSSAANNGPPTLAAATGRHQEKSGSNSPPQDEPNGTRRAPVEFNHAINYVNKIKNRFSNDPETYKQFLEILQTYQKEQKPIQEVYGQVQVLFNGANDLLAEFKQFLPDTSQPTTAATATTEFIQKKLLKKRSLSGLPKPKKMKTHHKSLEHVSDIRRSPIIVPINDTRPIIDTDEVEFFDSVKKYIGNKATYQSFLLVLNLFSQQILDANTLIEKCESFLGGSKELLDQLKKLVGYDGKDLVIENIPVINQQDSPNQQGEFGPSYRTVSKSWKDQSCSGRDSLCWQVLNDSYVSHPTWASEDGGFIASKKNIFEESLHRVEEERYDYDINIEANLNTISLLEPIEKKIVTMSEEEKNNFKLPPGLGGPSKTIYQRIIKKIYGQEQGARVVEMLHTKPAQSVPIVLQRLKQMDKEWKHSQREWIKVWREIEIKNYYKALDYQGVIFKTEDRKSMSVKSLVSEIRSTRLDQSKKPNHLANIEPQFQFQFKNKKIFKDVTRVLYSYFERQTTYGTEDCEVMKAFIEMFLPVFFDVPDVLPELNSEPASDTGLEEDEEMVDEEDAMDEDVDEDVDEDDDTQNSYDSSTDTSRSTRRGHSYSNGRRHTNGRRSPRHKTNDDDHQRLLKDVLTKTMKPLDKKVQLKEEVIPIEIEEEEEEDPNKEQKIYNLFGNTTFYCFFRLFQICYDRLCKMKELDRQYRINPEETKLANKAALELNVTTATFNSIEMDFKSGYYNALLKLIDRFFDDELDQHVFEECARYIFGTKAYIMFTIDKLMLSIMRQLHLIVTEPKAQELLSFFKKNHEHEKGSHELIQAYRLEVTDALGDQDNVYNLAFDTYTRTLAIQLLGKEDETFELNDSESYTNYVSNFIDWDHETPGVNRKDMTKQYLKRNLSGNKQDIVHVSELQYKICHNTYHMFYVVGTEDVYYRKKKNTNTSSNTFKLWLDKGKDQTELEEKARALFNLPK
ncbi:hypothetical protein HPULCUR_009064 [Helicostylum pulchrum]|uniref:Histone deacetylase interacting domain-containing protein n=1 Tax=Helicostylum pulchrum TaxID=562976 RepID=A0ABP9Y9D3_9FUNG